MNGNVDAASPVLRSETSGTAFQPSAWNLGRGSVLLRTIMNLEPATVTDRRYPLLFQVSETAYGKAAADGQHPHNLFMEIGVGEPALGPVAYPHRASASEFAQAPLGHHWEDSTLIADNVVTSGVTYKKMRLEASGFLYGAEPNENRWTIAAETMDSWSTRLIVLPNENWAAQISSGRLHYPEALSPATSYGPRDRSNTFAPSEARIHGR